MRTNLRFQSSRPSHSQRQRELKTLLEVVHTDVVLPRQGDKVLKINDEMGTEVKELGVTEIED